MQTPRTSLWAKFQTWRMLRKMRKLEWILDIDYLKKVPKLIQKTDTGVYKVARVLSYYGDRRVMWPFRDSNGNPGVFFNETVKYRELNSNKIKIGKTVGSVLLKSGDEFVGDDSL